MSGRTPILYLAPWVGYGGSDKNTIDWFRWIDQERFAPSLITTQPSPNPLLGEVAPHAEEIWVLPDLMPAEQMPGFIFDFLQSRRIEVLHVMNSRLAFDLLPDLSCLPSPPGVVIQLHVEEVDKSGYVRYVTTRYGNLVDRFSISNRHVAEAVRGYGVPEDKIDVIYTGVDAEAEFSPAASKPIEGLSDDGLQVLFAARLTDQKDPLLMLDVAAELRDRGAAFQFQVVGDGDLETQVRERIAELGLEEHVVLHPPAPGLRDWYATCDVLLLTSKFEGVPCVVFEAMAMGLPIVAPALPGIRELLDQADDDLIEQRNVTGYVEALSRLAESRDVRLARGEALRDRAKRRFSVGEMARRHEKIYEEVRRDNSGPAIPALPEQIRFRGRAVLGSPLVSVLIPHFNQTRFLRECVDSVCEQSYPNVDIIIVDDASTESGTDDLLEDLEASERIEVVRLEENGGPSRARNAGLERCRGRYILPVDADNLLLPDAVEKLVEQLNQAGEDVGFIYPNLLFFGNREEYHSAPPYNLYTLLHANFCDTCSLIDREVFDTGVRYNDEIRLGHEDWEFTLQLATHGIRGEPAHGPTVRYRKWGFNRSDMVDHTPSDFRQSVLVECSPFEGREAQIKAEEHPALSIVALSSPAADSKAADDLLAALAKQRCIDLELVSQLVGPEKATAGPTLRQVPVAVDPRESLQRGLSAARGAYLALTAGSGWDLLADPAFAEKVLRRFAALGEEPDVLVLADAGDEHSNFASLVDSGHQPGLVPHTVIWRRAVEWDLPFGLVGDPDAPVVSIVRLLTGGGCRVEWRHASLSQSVSAASATPPRSWIRLLPEWEPTPDPYGAERPARPLLPGDGDYEVRRWDNSISWIAPLSTLAVRYRERIGERRLVATGEPPAYFHLEHYLGSLRSTGVQGTKKLIAVADTFRALERGEWMDVPADAVELGYLEEAPLPGLDPIALAVHRQTGQHLLVSLPDDPILGMVDVIEHLGFADPFPLRPREVRTAAPPVGLVGLLKSADLEQRRHRYAVGGFAAGERIGELGGLAESGLQGSIPVWILGDYVLTDRYRPPVRKPSAAEALRWTGEPVTWGDLGPFSGRVKVMMRRSAMSVYRRARPGGQLPDPEGEPSGWLFASARPGLLPLHASHHPVTGDQLLTRSVEDALQMGYVETQLLGFMTPSAPLTGELDQRPIGVPWARRAGHVPRSG